MIQELEIQASELVKITITDASVRRYPLPQQQSRIEKGKIVAVQAYNSDNMPSTPEGIALISPTVFNAGYLTLKDKVSDTNDLNQVPLQDLQRSNNSGVYERIKPLKADLGQSYVEFGAGPVLVVGTVLMLRVIFIPEKKC
jgi:hypothetical protein